MRALARLREDAACERASSFVDERATPLLRTKVRRRARTRAFKAISIVERPTSTATIAATAKRRETAHFAHASKSCRRSFERRTFIIVSVTAAATAVVVVVVVVVVVAVIAAIVTIAGCSLRARSLETKLGEAENFFARVVRSFTVDRERVRPRAAAAVVVVVVVVVLALAAAVNSEHVIFGRFAPSPPHTPL